MGFSCGFVTNIHFLCRQIVAIALIIMQVLIFTKGFSKLKCLFGWLVGWCLCAMCMVITNEISSSSENVFNLCAVSIVAKFRKCYATHTNTPGHTCCKPALIRCSIQTTNWINEQIHKHSCKMRWQNKTEIVMSPQWWKGKSCLFK